MIKNIVQLRIKKAELKRIKREMKRIRITIKNPIMKPADAKYNAKLARHKKQIEGEIKSWHDEFWNRFSIRKGKNLKERMQSFNPF